ncbi:MAG: FecR domain-containing protein [Acidobacteriia bacterium]|nr:FecR domain-containing protein [Terriglobia bacterium]
MFSRPRFFTAVRAMFMAALVSTSLAPLEAQSGLPFGSGAAKLILMTGRVSVLKDGVEWARNVGDIVEPKQIILTGAESYAKFQLADGSTFEVFENTRAVFHETPGWDQLLNILIGRVKVYVDHSKGPNHKQVTTQTAIISVRGTIFDVVVEDMDATTFVSVEEGIVDVRHQIFGGNPIQLHQGESIRVFRDQRLAQAPDKGNAVRMALRAAAQAVYDVIYNRSGGTGGSTSPSAGAGGTAGGGSQGDKKPNPTGNAPPPPPPAGPQH